MTGYISVSLKDFIEEFGEDKIKNILSNFSCPLNPDVEKFLKYKAIEFSKQGISQTHLIFASYKKENELIGYFTLSPKTITILKNNLSKSLAKKISKFGTYDTKIKGYIISAPLIAQLGKNFNNSLDQLISGAELLKMACDKVKSIQKVLGGKIVYLECEDKPALNQFYKNNGFVFFGKRQLDKDEEQDLSGKYLNQMLKYIR